MLSRGIIYQSTCEGPGELDTGQERAICVSCDSYLISMEPSSKRPYKWLLLGIVHWGNMVKNLSAISISLDQSFASWDINPSSPHWLCVCMCQWVHNVSCLCVSSEAWWQEVKMGWQAWAEVLMNCNSIHLARVQKEWARSKVWETGEAQEHQ